MILYLGTSSLVKLYAEEPYSDVVREWVREAEIAATCRVAYTEIISALDIRFRGNDLTEREYEKFMKAFARDWINFAIVDFDDIEAGLLLKKYGLRRLDAMHLSAAKLIKKERTGITLLFSSLDEKLCSAAAAEGLKVLNFC
ncbi:MAG TPA: type II toxin-antitoxin system VapC family toxin [Candidatus Sulfobium mesophilum]|nr:type II toxin-antitoxin system VapC family toxin [Candidatus Sulfobium mesophilum]